MSFDISFGTEPELSEADEMERTLRNLQDEQNRLVEAQRENIRRITELKEQIRTKAINDRRAAELKKLEDERNAIIQSLEATRQRIESLTLDSWENAHNYQKEDIIQTFHAYLNDHKGFLNANDLGLGKTFEAIATLGAFFKEKPTAKCLWLTKSSILETGGTEREIKRWSDIPVVTIKGSTPAVQRSYLCEVLDDMSSVIVLTNYETVRTTPELAESTYEFVVMDEVHKLKGGANLSGPTGTWKAIRDFCWDTTKGKDPYLWEPRVEFIQMLSGTPMVNRVAELWAYLHIFDPVKFPSARQFENMFNVYKDLGGRIETGKILDMCLKDRMVPRTRVEVGLELPDVSVEEAYVLYTPEQERVYQEMKKQFYVWLDDQQEKALTATAIIAQLTRLRQISVWPVFKQDIKDEYGNIVDEVWIDVQESAKIDEAMEQIENHNDQVVVFCNFNEPFNEIQRRCKLMGLRCEFITGATKNTMSQMEIGFQNGEIDVLCINSSMGEGLNLQKNPTQWKGGANHAIHLDRWWNPARDFQCNGRIHRQGATHACTVSMIHSPGTVDDFVKALSDEKGELFSGIMDSEKIRPAYEWKEAIRQVLG